QEKVKKIAGVETTRTFMDAKQAGYIARVMRDPRLTDGIWKTDIRSALRVEGTHSEFDTTMDYVAAKALGQQSGTLICGGKCAKTGVHEVELKVGGDAPKWRWEEAIQEAERDATVVYTDW